MLTKTPRVIFFFAKLLFLAPADASCPPGMVPTGRGSSCIETLPWPGSEQEPAFVGASAVVEKYLDLGDEVWDAERLCASRGRRLCTYAERVSACRGTPRRACRVPSGLSYVTPDWDRVAIRDSRELARLYGGGVPADYPACVSPRGVRMCLGYVREWVRLPKTKKRYAMTSSYWGRESYVENYISEHAPNWHGYETGVRCCL